MASGAETQTPLGELTTLLPDPLVVSGFLHAFGNRSFAPSAFALSTIFSISAPPKLYTDLRLWIPYHSRANSRKINGFPLIHLFQKFIYMYIAPSVNLLRDADSPAIAAYQLINQVFVYLRKTPSDTDAGGVYKRIKK